MLRTQTPTSSFTVAVVYQAHFPVVSLWYSVLRPIYYSFLGVAFSNMLRLTHNFKIFYTVISLNVIDVVYLFGRKQLASKVLLHNIAVVQHAFAAYIYTQVAKRRKQRTSFLKHIPIWRDVIISMSVKPRAVHITNFPASFSKFITLIDITYRVHIPNRTTGELLLQA